VGAQWAGAMQWIAEALSVAPDSAERQRLGQTAHSLGNPLDGL